MFDLDQWQEILSTLRRNALRTFLTAVGVFWGVLMLVVMVAFGAGLERGVHKDMAGLATKAIYVWADNTSLAYNGLPPGRWVPLTRSDAAALEASFADLEAVAPRVQLNGRNGADVVTRGDKSSSFNISGDVPALIRIQPEIVTSGRFLDAIDMERRRKVAVIGARVAEVLFPPGTDPVGESIRIKGTDFLVVGVFKTPTTGDRADRMLNTIHVPISTFQQVLNPNDAVNNLAVLVRRDADSADVEARLKRFLLRRHRASPDDKEAVGTWNTEQEFQKIDNLFVGISLLIWFVGTVTLLAGIIGVSNIMMISVRERTKEIGIKRAIGATPWTILSQILKESIVLTAIAGFAGLAAGVGLLELVTLLMQAPSGGGGGGGRGPGGPSMFDAPHADFGVGMAATAVVVVGGAIAGLFPAIAAIRVRPVVALRDE
ncbi:MAG: ABC transporter permease [Polyangiaceae bacterium]